MTNAVSLIGLLSKRMTKESLLKMLFRIASGVSWNR